MSAPFSVDFLASHFPEFLVFALLSSHDCKSRRHVSEAISLISGTEHTNLELSLELVYCYITKLDVVPALQLLDQ